MDVELSQRLAEVIRTDATTQDTADFLATHSPFHQLRFGTSGISMEGIVQMDEDTLLQEHLLAKRTDHQFFVVQGDNGSGKSHLIRWIKEKMVQHVRDDSEAVVFISRSQSTLRGAIEQILHSQVFEDNEIQDLETLVRANEHLDASTLKQNIILQFAIAVQNDIDHGGEIANKWIKRRYQRDVYPFLADRAIQKLLFEKNGPIDRIYERLVSDNSNARKDDIDPHFSTEDLRFAFATLTRLRNEALFDSQAASGLAADLASDADLRQQLSGYLNQLLEPVVQSCTNLRAADLRGVFEQLRRSLKSRGKNLTLFIEDITSFTGIDGALVEVLVTEHLGNAHNQSMCRLFSVVGITNQYFRTFFPDSLKERVTGRIFVDQASLTTSGEISEMVGRYLNAIYVSPDRIRDWVATGASFQELPIADNMMGHHWALHQSSDDLVLPLYPFNRTALENIYQGLEQKTPRSLLRSVKLLLQQYFALSPTGEFPPSTRVLGTEFQMPQWADSAQEPIVAKQNGSERLSTFLRLWGNGTVTRQEFGGEVLVGGLPESAFKDFHLPFIQGIEGKSDRKKPTQQTEMGPNDTAEDPLKPLPPRRNKAFEDAQRELENWIARNEPLRTDYRRDIQGLLIDFVSGEFEDIPAKVIFDSFKVDNIDIEGLNITSRRAFTFNLKRTQETQFILLGLAAWRHLGQGSWDFPESIEHLTRLYSWLDTMQPRVRSFILESLSVREHGPDALGLLGVTASLHIQAYLGHWREYEETAVYAELFAPLSRPQVDRTHGSAWNGMSNEINAKWVLIEQHRNHLIHLYNCFQGGPAASASVVFLDAMRLLNHIQSARDNQWSAPAAIPIAKVSAADEQKMDYVAMRILNIFSELDYIIADEKKFANSHLEWVKQEIGDIDTDAVHRAFADITRFLKYLVRIHEPYPSPSFDLLTNNRLNADDLMEILQTLHVVMRVEYSMDGLQMLGTNPFSKLSAYSELFGNLNKLLDSKIADFRRKVILDDAKSSAPFTAEVDALRRVARQIEALLGGDAS